MAVAALVLGIASLALFCVWYVSIPSSILAIIFGNIGRKRAIAGASGGGMAKAGLVCGVIGLGLAIVIVGLLCAGVSLLGGEGLQQIFREAAEQGGGGPATQPGSP